VKTLQTSANQLNQPKQKQNAVRKVQATSINSGPPPTSYKNLSQRLEQLVQLITGNEHDKFCSVINGRSIDQKGAIT